MNSTKLFGFLAFLVLTLVVLGAGSASAALSFTAPADLTPSQNSTLLQLNTGDSGQTSITSLALSSTTITQGSASVTLALSGFTLPFNINQTTPQSITVSVQSLVGTLPFGTYSVTLNTAGTNSSNDAVNATVPIKYVQSFCKAGARGGNLSVDRVDISSSGDEDEEWKLLDDVDIEVRVENNGANDFDDVVVELGLFDGSGRNMVNDLDFSNSDEEKIDIGSLNDDKDETVNFKFTVPADFDTGDYKLVVKVYSEDEGENRECDDTSSDLGNNLFQTISIDNENDEEKFVVVDDIEMPEQTTCRETVTGSFTVFNIGDEDQDQVLITMKNAELGLNQEFEIREDLDKGDDQNVDFSFEVPQGTRDGTYLIAFKTFYSFDDGDYEQESEDQFTSSIKVIGCGTPTTPPTDTIEIDAELDSDAKAGEKLVVRATITNSGDEEATIRVNVDGYESWAELDSISRRTVTLAAGESATVEVVFKVNADVSGSESFVLTATADNRVETQEVEVDFGDAPTGRFTFFQGSALIWAIVIVNIVLIALIILVAVRLARR